MAITLTVSTNNKDTGRCTVVEQFKSVTVGL